MLGVLAYHGEEVGETTPARDGQPQPGLDAKLVPDEVGQVRLHQGPDTGLNQFLDRLVETQEIVLEQLREFEAEVPDQDRVPTLSRLDEVGDKLHD